MELGHIEYPLPDPIARLLFALVAVAKRNDMLTLSYTEVPSTKDRGAFDILIGDPAKGKDVVVPRFRGSPITTLEMLGLVERVNESSVFLYPIAFEREKYERKNRFGKWLARILRRRGVAVLAVTAAATFLLVVLQIAKITGLIK